MVPARVVGEPAQPRVPFPPDDGGGGARHLSPRTARLQKRRKDINVAFALQGVAFLQDKNSISRVTL
jgi:hypothetical protein